MNVDTQDPAPKYLAILQEKHEISTATVPGGKVCFIVPLGSLLLLFFDQGYATFDFSTKKLGPLIFPQMCFFKPARVSKSWICSIQQKYKKVLLLNPLENIVKMCRKLPIQSTQDSQGFQFQYKHQYLVFPSSGIFVYKQSGALLHCLQVYDAQNSPTNSVKFKKEAVNFICCYDSTNSIAVIRNTDQERRDSQRRGFQIMNVETVKVRDVWIQSPQFSTHPTISNVVNISDTEADEIMCIFVEHKKLGTLILQVYNCKLERLSNVIRKIERPYCRLLRSVMFCPTDNILFYQELDRKQLAFKLNVHSLKTQLTEADSIVSTICEEADLCADRQKRYLAALADSKVDKCTVKIWKPYAIGSMRMSICLKAGVHTIYGHQMLENVLSLLTNTQDH